MTSVQAQLTRHGPRVRWTHSPTSDRRSVFVIKRASFGCR